jgi:serine protease Do
MQTRVPRLVFFTLVSLVVLGLGMPWLQATQANGRPARPVTAELVSGPVGLHTFRDIARRANPAVVNISSAKVVRGPRRLPDPFERFFGPDLFERFFGPRQGRRPSTRRSLGSGFVIDAEGHVLTNWHVVRGADEITVALSDEKRLDAKLVGRDARTDVALLRVDSGKALSALELGDSDAAQVGEWVMAIGNPFGLGGNSVTVGVVSYTGRPLRLAGRPTPVEMIQTDASINPGNSGGPLLDASGRVIGINTLIVTEGARQSAGVGFAVPINVAKQILPQLREKGKVVRGWLGVVIQPVGEELARTFGMEEPRGVVVADVAAGGPAEKAGLEPDDVVIEADGRPIDDPSDLSDYVSSRGPGAAVRVLILRDGQEKEVTVTLGTFPEEGAEGAGATRFGMALRQLTPDVAARLALPRDAKGIVVTDVEAGGAAEEAGLRARDVIVSVSGEPVSSVAGFEAAIERARKDGLARLRLRRGSSYLFVVLKLS